MEAECDEPRAAGFRYAKNKYITFVNETNAYYSSLENNRRFYLESYWEADALIRFNGWLSSQALKSKSRYGIYKTVRQVMDMAYALRVIDTIVYHAPMFKGVSETKERSAYTDEEQEIINAAVAKWMSLSVSVLRGYQPIGQGVPYRRKNYLPPISVDGQLYGIAEASLAFGVAHGTITLRIEQGWTPRQSIGLDPSPSAPSLNWTFNGVVYQSMAAISKRFGIATSVIRYRIKTGWTPEQIVGLVQAPERDFSKLTGKATPTIVGEQVFSSLKEASRHYSIDYRVLKQRLHQGWSIGEAFGLDKREPSGLKITIEGVAYKSISAAAVAYGIASGTLALHLRKGYSPEQAVGVVPRQVPQNDERALLWSFENEYNCDAYDMLTDFNRRKLSAVGSEKKLRKLFSRWGVWPYVDDRLVMPLAVEMGMLTGLNVEALKTLEIDSYQVSHRLTGQPVITYRKKRSGSATRSEDRELHLPVLELEDLYIDESVAEKITRLVQLILAITSKIRSDAPSEISRRLFIFEDVELSRKTGERVVVPLDPKRKAGHWYRRFCKEEGLNNIFGHGFNFNISRCRPTLATNMVLAGADMFQVQVALGHESIQTTATYLDEQRLKPAFNRTVSEALERISRRSVDLQHVEQMPEVPSVGCNGCGNQGFHETLSGCGCSNPYSPSEHVRLVTKHKEGSVCRFWNMCLLCDSAVITESSLPKLIVYRTRVAAALDEDSLAIRARKELFRDVIKLVDGILQSDVIFPASVIEKARCLAATMDDLLVDQLIYQGL